MRDPKPMNERIKKMRTWICTLHFMKIAFYLNEWNMNCIEFPYTRGVYDIRWWEMMLENCRNCEYMHCIRITVSVDHNHHLFIIFISRFAIRCHFRFEFCSDVGATCYCYTNSKAVIFLSFHFEMCWHLCFVISFEIQW